MAERRIATCPTCLRLAEFQYVGEQHWPADAAEELGLPATVRLWSCLACLTTITEQYLWPVEGRPCYHRKDYARAVTSARRNGKKSP